VQFQRHYTLSPSSLSEAEDIFQETFLKAWQHLKSFNPQKALFRSWLFQIANNTLKSHKRLLCAVRAKGAMTSMDATKEESDSSLHNTIRILAPTPEQIAYRNGIREIGFLIPLEKYQTKTSGRRFFVFLSLVSHTPKSSPFSPKGRNDQIRHSSRPSRPFTGISVTG